MSVRNITIVCALYDVTFVPNIIFFFILVSSASTTYGIIVRINSYNILLFVQKKENNKITRAILRKTTTSLSNTAMVIELYPKKNSIEIKYFKHLLRRTSFLIPISNGTYRKR